MRLVLRYLRVWAVAGALAGPKPCSAADTSPEMEVGEAFEQAIQEHQAFGGPPREGEAGQLLRSPGSISEPGHVLPQSAALDRLVEGVHRLHREDARGLSSYFEAARAFLDHPSPQLRAVACEFLALYPACVLPSDVLPRLGDLLADQAGAFPGLRFRGPQRSVPFNSRGLVPRPRPEDQFRVADLARCALENATHFSFHDREAFLTWWQANQDPRARLWYWARQTSVREEDLQSLTGLDPRASLRILLLVDNHAARRVEGALPWILSGDKRDYRSVIPMATEEVRRPEPAMVAGFVQKHSLEDFLIELLAGECPWPEVAHENYLDEERLNGSIARLYLMDRLLPVAELALRREHAFRIEEASRRRFVPPAFHPGTAGRLTLLCARLDPARAEQVILAHLDRDPGEANLVAALVAKTGTKHWKKIKALYAGLEPDPGKKQVVLALGGRDEEGRAALRELIVQERPSATRVGRESGADLSAKEGLFRAFVDAAQRLNGGQAVIDEELLRKACFAGGKSDWPQLEHNLEVPAAREEALRKLSEFFAG